VVSLNLNWLIYWFVNFPFENSRLASGIFSNYIGFHKYYVNCLQERNVVVMPREAPHSLVRRWSWASRNGPDGGLAGALSAYYLITR
jgi:hypothetical protein